LPIHSAQRAQPNIFDISDGVKRIRTRNNKRVITGLTPGRYSNRSGEYEVLVDGTVWLIGGQDLPDGAGKDLVTKVCTLCHDTARIISKKWSKEEWNDTVDKMAMRGARASDEEFDAIVAYLAKNFGKD